MTELQVRYQTLKEQMRANRVQEGFKSIETKLKRQQTVSDIAVDKATISKARAEIERIAADINRIKADTALTDVQRWHEIEKMYLEAGDAIRDLVNDFYDRQYKAVKLFSDMLDM